jgi:catechol 2,3-dioxygenase-like lactoylglutathione lyase family enzyme
MSILPLTSIDLIAYSIRIDRYQSNSGEGPMSRVQLALNVGDLDKAITFYSKLFDAEPAKVRPGYANFAIADPPLKLVLIEKVDDRGEGVSGALNHLGVEVESSEQVQRSTRRLTDEGLIPDVQENTTCCYAVQDKAWVDDPDGAPWEVYTVLADAPHETDLGCSSEACAPEALALGASRQSCC